MLKVSKVWMIDIIRTIERSIDYEDEELWNKMNQMVTWSLLWQWDLEANWQFIERQTKDNLENGEKYARLTETPYWNLMFDE
jgi:hypothetical protein